MFTEETSEYKYQTLIDILAEMVKTYLTSNPKEKGVDEQVKVKKTPAIETKVNGGAKHAEPCNESKRPA